jgi:hypothetical protein
VFHILLDFYISAAKIIILFDFTASLPVENEKKEVKNCEQCNGISWLQAYKNKKAMTFSGDRFESSIGISFF